MKDYHPASCCFLIQSFIITINTEIYVSVLGETEDLTGKTRKLPHTVYSPITHNYETMIVL